MMKPTDKRIKKVTGVIKHSAVGWFLGWTEERLPEDLHESYLIYSEYEGDYYYGVSIADYDENLQSWWDLGGDKVHPTHWMPLPQYEKEKNIDIYSLKTIRAALVGLGMSEHFNAPKIIYLFDMGNGEIVWCEDAAPEPGVDEKDGNN